MGKFFEEFSVGDQFITPERIITEKDIAAFADLTEVDRAYHAGQVDLQIAAFSDDLGPRMQAETMRAWATEVQQRPWPRFGARDDARSGTDAP